MNAISSLALDLQYLDIQHFLTENGEMVDRQEISYQVFGRPLGSAPIVLVVHALTGNSTVAGERGWWNELIAAGKTIDTRHFSILAIDIPGNGFSGSPESLLPRPDLYTARDIARLFLLVLHRLEINKLHAAIGGSLGGGIIWELALIAPKMIRFLIPIASDWKSTDWIIAHNRVQKEILEHSDKPLEIARMMAMLFYRSGTSFSRKFSRQRQDAVNIYQVESWLIYHGEKLRDRFHLQAYKTMNHLLSTIDICRGRNGLSEILQSLECEVLQIGIDSDIFFDPEENKRTHRILQEAGVKSSYAEIQSIHGHDAFLMEYDQLSRHLAPCFPRPGTNGSAGKAQVGVSRTKTVPLVLFGPGSVGNTLLRQIRKSRETIRNGKGLDLQLIAVANSKSLLLDENDLSGRIFPESLQEQGIAYQLPELLQYIRDQQVGEFVAIDATTGDQLARSYPDLIRTGAHIASANKTANTMTQEYYEELRRLLDTHNRQFRYETNVGAGLPLISTIRELHDCGEEIKKIRGVFSGSLSYIFNRFGRKDIPFTEILAEAREFGLTEPDPLEDLSGNDVGRKLLILARELNLRAELEEVSIESLIPPGFIRTGDLTTFRHQREVLDDYFRKRKNKLEEGHVLRYVGEVNLTERKLRVELQAVPADGNLGHIKGADSVFEIYSNAYRQPMVIQGAGAGPEVTARGLLSDILKIGSSAFR